MFAYAFIDDPQPEVWTNKLGSGKQFRQTAVPAELLQKNHLLRFDIFACLQAVEVDAAGDVRSVPR
jgi:hypothetical protein